jgi:hypothetical protein
VFGVLPGAANSAKSYSCVFRNGVVEGVDTGLLQNQAFPGGPHSIPATLVAGAVITAARRYVKLQQSLGVQPPLALGLSLLGVKGFQLTVDDRISDLGLHEIMHDDLVFPEVALRDAEEDPMALLKITFDQLWNAGGLPRCADYLDTRKLTTLMSQFE